MANNKHPIFYSCPSGHGNYTNKKCGICGAKCNPVYEIPSERDFNKDPTYFDYLRKKRNNQE